MLYAQLTLHMYQRPVDQFAIFHFRLTISEPSMFIILLFFGQVLNEVQKLDTCHSLPRTVCSRSTLLFFISRRIFVE